MRKRGNKILVVGVGNDLRGDDGAGPAVIDALQPLDGLQAVCAKHDGDGASLMDLWQEFGNVILIDAVRSGQAPGTVHFINAAQQSLPSGWFHYSSHAFGVAEAVELARILGALPPTLHIIGVEGHDFSMGVPLSEAVEARMDYLCALVRRDMQCIRNGEAMRLERPCHA
ncbi:MAG: hydrogenase maturation protease [Candidatus Hydrogenedentes bacterium]|nr:hydrogenase maturation protease [Candidatus Hydrogenedentota bacterium]